ncbi:HPr family phosphocarrier protein [Ethanoligenens harbinense]|uniref:Phosphotransferase system, phosphocarrier protein HPr n=1 Tax=Ethanoligenens harbinense (strain DSM 18485 / JCM 12961 / CGMCC 1.5033 / YUAN-3) TaxID=663278 RepID=E6U8D1_ETHHY|nr:HPr family phosphocarrier protein [Ethanoligenens harbinense]ADU28250.1 Phosphotransferase system, phosphocarrier protein HPr [Ethanoligenens harbinense YUAN-3]AVQ97245.1 HPr family phosphocarrier protein [Ethanoligenens harbinense YUAN-3]AYF39910.1 HPr family phosphocarrier protein [Ethanoligenens harbinense]AYF42740.1 HPr family phosphocarrier protein [Ethanoligenens harbinense]QCN93490.1 HPr family phosphocarrier protein [Ethanoligenens harbinense]
MMITKEFTITGAHGFHLRPAQVLVKTVTKFQSNVIMEKADGTQANAKSLLNVMTLGLEQGQNVTVKVHGPDENQAMQAIGEQFACNFGE